MAEEVRSLLVSLELEQHADRLILAGYDTIHRIRLETWEMLTTQGIPPGHALDILNAAKALLPEPPNKRRHTHAVRTIPIGSIASETENLVIPFNTFETCDRLLSWLDSRATENSTATPLVIIHGPYASGKSSLMRYVESQLLLHDGTDICFMDCSDVTWTPNLTKEGFWEWFAPRVLTSEVKERPRTAEAVVDILSRRMMGRKWFLLIDELELLLNNKRARIEFLTFARAISTRNAITSFFGGLLGAGTHSLWSLIRSPEATPAVTPDLDVNVESLSADAVSEPLLYQLISPAVRSPFEKATFLLMETLDLPQTAQYFKKICNELPVDIEDDVVSDVFSFTGGNIAFVTTCAHLILKKRTEGKIQMQQWEKVKIEDVADFLSSHNRMVKHVIDTIDTSLQDDMRRQFLINLIRYDGVINVMEHHLGFAELLHEVGMVLHKSARTVEVASPYLQMLLVQRLYRKEPDTAHLIPTMTVDGGTSIDSIGLLELALKLMNPALVTTPWSKIPSGAAIQAELYAAFKSIGDGVPSSPVTYATYLDVKRGRSSEQRLSLMLRSELNATFGHFAGFELKVNLLRAIEVEEAVRTQAAKYKDYHNIGDMFLVNFIPYGHLMEDVMPGKYLDVQCVYVRFDAKFQNLVIHAPGIFPKKRGFTVL
ncbi:hypothetical protein BC832DRAFT_165835 [Gaertneriomyces semiglobifer]|nr:hypothetical protein BC832DRAFT_165835 [Gaertneriomyces semiglobifer]